MESAARRTEEVKVWVKTEDSQPMKLSIERSCDICDVVDLAIMQMVSLRGVTNERVAVKCGGSAIERDSFVSSVLSKHHGVSAKSALVLYVLPTLTSISGFPRGLSMRDSEPSTSLSIKKKRKRKKQQKASNDEADTYMDKQEKIGKEETEENQVEGTKIRSCEHKENDQHSAETSIKVSVQQEAVIAERIEEKCKNVMCWNCKKCVSQDQTKVCIKCKDKTVCYKCIVDGGHNGKSVCADCALEIKDQVWLFLDNSNLWIESKKLRAEKRHLTTKEDHRVRINFGGLITCIQTLREKSNGSKGKVSECNFYGSKPPDTDSVWRMAEQQGWKRNIKDKAYNGKEKEVDTQIVADVTELASTSTGGTIILITGDRDLRPCIQKALEFKWGVEVYMWKHAASKEFGDMGIFSSLDSQFEEITFIEWEYKDQVKKNALGFEYTFKADEKETFFRKIEQLIHLPFQYCKEKDWDFDFWQLVFHSSCKKEDIEKSKCTIDEKMYIDCYTLEDQKELAIKDGYKRVTYKHNKKKK